MKTKLTTLLIALAALMATAQTNVLSESPAFKEALTNYYAELEITNSTNQAKRAFSIAMVRPHNGSLELTMTNGVAVVMITVTNLVRSLAAHGVICAEVGHQWKPNRTYMLAIYPPPVTRTCDICNTTQTLVEEWK